MGLYKPGRPFKCRPAERNSVTPPAKAGEYRIRNASGEILYVGETNNLARRMKEHIRSGKLSSAGGGVSFEYKIANGRSSSRTRRIHERQKIAQHHPVLNKSKGGEGRPAGKKHTVSPQHPDQNLTGMLIHL